MERIIVIDLTNVSKENLTKALETFIAERRTFHKKFYSLTRGKNISELSADELKKYIELAAEESDVNQ